MGRSTLELFPSGNARSISLSKLIAPYLTLRRKHKPHRREIDGRWLITIIGRVSDTLTLIVNRAFPETLWTSGFSALLEQVLENVSAYTICHQTWSEKLYAKFSNTPEFSRFVERAAMTFRRVFMQSEGVRTKAESFAVDRFNKKDKLSQQEHRARMHAFFTIVNDLKEALFLDLPVVALHPSFASGDMFGIGASLAIDKHSSVIIINDDTSDLKDHSKMLADFYKSFLHESRVRCFSYPPPNLGPLRKKGKPRLVIPWKKVERKEMVSEFIVKKATAKSIQWPVDVDYGTRYLSYQDWRTTAARRCIRRAWRVNPFMQESTYGKMLVWLTGRGLPLNKMKGKHVVVIWSRFSGKKGDIHIEHDTSFQGTRQLIDMALTTRSDYVIILGDKPIVPDYWNNQKQRSRERAKKFSDIADNFNFVHGHRCVFDLTSYWEDPKIKTWCKSRIDQFKLCEYLHRLCVTKHIGFRSGNLEAMALLGYKVRYLEEPDSKGADRMTRWHDTGLGYERISITEVPTRSGKYAKSARIDRPNWVPLKRDSDDRKPNEIGQEDRGFSTKDLLLIRAYLDARVPMVYLNLNAFID